jgi:hypothetical protein
MKGIVFTEFLDMVEDKFGDEMVDDIIKDSNLSTNGAYTAIGTYPHSEIITLVVNLSKYSKIPVPDLVYVFGKHLFGRFTTLYASLLEGYNDAFTFLEGIETYIHVEVKKLYPDAQLPFFNCHRENGQLVMDYKSDRAMADLAHGLMDGSFEYFNQNVDVKREDTGGGDGTSVRFYLTKIEEQN